MTTQQTVFSYDNAYNEHSICQIVVYIGDGVNDLDGSGGDFELTLILGDFTVQPEPQLIYFDATTQSSIFTEQFPLRNDQTVTVKLKSPNAADSAVYVRACIYEIGIQSIRAKLDYIASRVATTTISTTGGSASGGTSGAGGGVYATTSGLGTGVIPGHC